MSQAPPCTSDLDSCSFSPSFDADAQVPYLVGRPSCRVQLSISPSASSSPRFLSTASAPPAFDPPSSSHLAPLYFTGRSEDASSAQVIAESARLRRLERLRRQVAPPGSSKAELIVSRGRIVTPQRGRQEGATGVIGADESAVVWLADPEANTGTADAGEGRELRWDDTDRAQQPYAGPNFHRWRPSPRQRMPASVSMDARTRVSPFLPSADHSQQPPLALLAPRGRPRERKMPLHPPDDAPRSLDLDSFDYLLDPSLRPSCEPSPALDLSMPPWPIATTQTTRVPPPRPSAAATTPPDERAAFNSKRIELSPEGFALLDQLARDFLPPTPKRSDPLKSHPPTSAGDTKPRTSTLIRLRQPPPTSISHPARSPSSPPPPPTPNLDSTSTFFFDTELTRPLRIRDTPSSSTQIRSDQPKRDKSEDKVASAPTPAHPTVSAVSVARKQSPPSHPVPPVAPSRTQELRVHPSRSPRLPSPLQAASLASISSESPSSAARSPPQIVSRRAAKKRERDSLRAATWRAVYRPTGDVPVSASTNPLLQRLSISVAARSVDATSRAFTDIPPPPASQPKERTRQSRRASQSEQRPSLPTKRPHPASLMPLPAFLTPATTLTCSSSPPSPASDSKEPTSSMSPKASLRPSPAPVRATSARQGSEAFAKSDRNWHRKQPELHAVLGGEHEKKAEIPGRTKTAARAELRKGVPEWMR